MMFVGSAGLTKSLCVLCCCYSGKLEGTAFTVGDCMISEATES